MPTPSPTTWHIHSHDCVPSTNDLALADTLDAWNLHRSAHGILHIAHQQTHGRGQHGRAWSSPKGGLYLSAVAENIPPLHRHRLPLVVGVALAQALESSNLPQLQIRWPNDLVFQQKKIAGILCESVARGDNFATIIGIGLNLNTAPQAFPPDLQPRATSLSTLIGHPLDPQKISRAIQHHLADALHRTAEIGLSWAIDFARSRDPLLGQTLRIHTHDQHLTGRGAGLSPTGELLLDCSGTLRSITLGTLTHLADLPLR